MLGVVLGHGRRAAGPAEPVVEGAEPDEEAERARDRGHDQVRVAGLLGLEDLEAGDRAQRNDQPEAECRFRAGGRSAPRPSPGFFNAAATPYLLKPMPRPSPTNRPLPLVRSLRLGLLGEPLIELLLRLHDHGGPHRRVTGAAELRADEAERALLVGGDDELVVDPLLLRIARGHRIALDPPLRHPERVQDVEGAHRHLELAADRHVQLVGGDRSRGVASPDHLLRVLEGPLELLADHVERHPVGSLGLDVVEHDPAVAGAEEDDDRRDHGPGDLEARVAVDRLAVGLVARLGAELPERVGEHHHDDREDEAREHDHHVEERVDRAALSRSGVAEPVELQQHDRAQGADHEHRRDQSHVGHPGHCGDSIDRGDGVPRTSRACFKRLNLRSRRPEAGGSSPSRQLIPAGRRVENALRDLFPAPAALDRRPQSAARLVAIGLREPEPSVDPSGELADRSLVEFERDERLQRLGQVGSQGVADLGGSGVMRGDGRHAGRSRLSGDHAERLGEGAGKDQGV